MVDGLVALDHGVQQLHLEVGEGAAEELDDLFHALAIGRKPGQRVVVDEVGSEQLVDDVDPALAEDLAAHPPEDVSLVLGRQRHAPRTHF